MAHSCVFAILSIYLIVMFAISNIIAVFDFLMYDLPGALIAVFLCLFRPPIWFLALALGFCHLCMSNVWDSHLHNALSC